MRRTSHSIRRSTRTRARHAAPLLALLAAAASSCAPPLRRFPLAAPMWRDTADTRPVAPRPAEYTSSDLWDFVDQTSFHVAMRAMSVPVEREATDVNALDEVPDSSWFDNRALRGAALAPEAVARGGCTTPPLDPAQPWTVTEAKPNGFNPGFIIRGPDGRRYLLKADGERQGELATAADVIGSRIYHALGYNAPCNRIVYFARDTLRIDPAAQSERETRTHRRLTPEVIDRVLRLATRTPDGRYRMNASLFLEGTPLGPFQYTGTRADDPNDVVPHEDRRELRGARVLAAWLNHYDAREQNTFTTWIEAPGAGGAGYVRHWMLDFGDLFGALWPWDALTARSGHTHTVDLGQIGADFLSLGLIRRPWDNPTVDPHAWIFGYYSARDFDPDGWRPIAPNPAFARMTERDAAWMARLIARFDQRAINAAVATGEFSYAPWSRYLERTLAARRTRILARYLARLSPFADAALEGDARLCATDLAARNGLRSPQPYRAVRFTGARLDERTPLPIAPVAGAPARVCAALPPPTAPEGGPRYLVVDLVGAARGRAPLRVHLYDLGPSRGYRLVGLERPDDDAAPRG